MEIIVSATKYPNLWNTYRHFCKEQNGVYPDHNFTFIDNIEITQLNEAEAALAKLTSKEQEIFACCYDWEDEQDCGNIDYTTGLSPKCVEIMNRSPEMQRAAKIFDAIFC